jgi:hypothetical protein
VYETVALAVPLKVIVAEPPEQIVVVPDMVAVGSAIMSYLISAEGKQMPAGLLEIAYT